MSDSNHEPEPKITFGDFAVLREIGTVATFWGMLELVVDTTVWRLMEVEPAAGACVTGNMPSIFPKMDALIALCHLRGVSGETIRKLTAIKNQMYPLAQERAAAVHGAVAIFEHEDGSKVTQQVRIKSRGEPFLGMTPVTPDSLSKVWQDISKLHLKLLDTLSAVWAETSPSPESNLG